MDLLGQAVHHKVFGKGIVTDFCKNKMTVCFAQSQKLFLFPDAIPRYLTLKNVSLQKKIEDINEERERVIREKRRKIEEENRYRKRLYTMKILPKSQVAYNISNANIEKLEYIETGYFLSGNMKGKPRVPVNIQPNSAILLTECLSDREDERAIIGVAMAGQRFWGQECRDGMINLHNKYKVILPEDQKLSFWQYFKREVFPARWGSVPFRYFQNQTMEKILLDICQNAAGTDQAQAVLDFYRYFCKLNRISEKKIAEGEE